MAIQILPHVGLGERLGTALGTGLGAGIQGLAQHKLGEIERQKGIQKAASGLQALGAPAELANLPQNLQGIVLKQILQQPGQESYANALSSLLGGAPQQQAEAGSRNVPNLRGLTQQQTSELARLGLQKQKAATQESQFATKEARIEQHHIDKETKPYYDEISKAFKAAKNTNPVLARMQTLLNNGNLPDPVFYGLANKVGGAFGLNVGALRSADAQEFEKLTNEFLKNAKDIFGSRLTNYDVQTFLKGIPSLSQSDQGKQRIINNLETINEGALLKQQALRSIIAENGGKRPANLSELVEERVEPQLDQLAEMFAQGTPVGKSLRRVEDSIANRAVGAQEVQNAQQQQTNQLQSPLEQIPLYGTRLNQAPKQSPSTLQEAGRFIGRTGARAAESVLGIPGDIASAGLGLANFVTGGRIPGVEGAQQYIPSSTNLRKATRALTGESLEPKNEIEKLGDELVSDFATFALPIKGKFPFKSAAIKSLLGNAASFLAKKFGAGPLGETGAKVGTLLAYNAAGGRKVLENVMKESYINAGNIAGTAKESAKELSKDISIITKDITRGIKTPGKTFVADHIKGLTDSIKNGKIPVKDAWSLKREVNELLRDKETPDTAKKYLGRLTESLNKVLGSYGKANQEFGKAFHQAEDIYKGLNQASDISKTIQKIVSKETIKSPAVKGLFAGLAYKAPGLIPAATATLGTAYGIRNLVRATELFKNSSEARKYYLNVAKAAAREDASLVERNIRKLDDLATKEGY